jgi:hypothetical protein
MVAMHAPASFLLPLLKIPQHDHASLAVKLYREPIFVYSNTATDGSGEERVLDLFPFPFSLFPFPFIPTCPPTSFD